MPDLNTIPTPLSEVQPQTPEVLLAQQQVALAQHAQTQQQQAQQTADVSSVGFEAAHLGVEVGIEGIVAMGQLATNGRANPTLDATAPTAPTEAFQNGGGFGGEGFDSGAAVVETSWMGEMLDSGGEILSSAASATGDVLGDAVEITGDIIGGIFSGLS